MKRLLLCITAILLGTPSQVSAQQSIGTIRIDYASMLVTKQGIGRWTAARNDNPGTVTWANGTTTKFPHVGIPETPVRGILNRAVDPCIASGTGDDGCVLTLNLPREPVKLMMGRPTAVQIIATGMIVWPDGKKFSVIVTYPASATHRVGRRTRQAAGVIATGEIFK